MTLKKQKKTGRFSGITCKSKKATKKPKYTTRPYKPRKPKVKKSRTDDEILAAARKDLKRFSERTNPSNRPRKPQITVYKTPVQAKQNRSTIIAPAADYFSTTDIKIADYVRYTRPDIERDPYTRRGVSGLSAYDPHHHESIQSVYTDFDRRVKTGHFRESEKLAFLHFSKATSLNFNQLDNSISRNANEAIWKVFSSWKKSLPAISLGIASELRSTSLPIADLNFFQKKDFGRTFNLQFGSEKGYIAKLMHATHDMKSSSQETRRSAIEWAVGSIDRNDMVALSDSLSYVINAIDNETYRLINLTKCRIGLTVFG